jgi:Na+/H+-dicarboxylate symporter
MKKIIQWINSHFSLTLLVSVIIGVVLGIVLGDSASVLKPFGTIFTRLLVMMVPVLVLFSISSSFANIGDAKKLSRWGGKVILWFLFTTTIAIILGIICGEIFKPGVGASIAGYEAVEAVGVTVDDYIAWLPANFLGCIAEGNTVQIVFLAMFIGIAVVTMKDTDETKSAVTRFLNHGMDLTLKIIQGIMYYAPIGIIGLTASGVSSMKNSFLETMGSFLIAFTIAWAAQIIICYFGMLSVIGKVNPFKFTKKMFPALITAFTTTSSSGTLPMTLKCTKDLGVDDEIADFGIPLGVTFNMDSMGILIPLYIFLGMGVIGQTPNVGDLFIMVVMGIAFSVGCAGVPGGGLAIAAILIDAFGLPTECVGWIAACFFYIDAVSTPMNIWGDAVCSLIVAKGEGRFNIDKFNS